MAGNKAFWIFITSLTLGASLFSYVRHHTSDAEKATLMASKNLQLEVKKSQSFLSGLVKGQPQHYESRQNFPYPHFIFQSGRLTYWSDHEVTPKYRDISGIPNNNMLNLHGGHYLVVKKDTIITGRSSMFITLIPLLNHPIIKNKHLRTTFNQEIFVNENFQLSSEPLVGYRPLTNDEGHVYAFFSTNKNYHTIPEGVFVLGYFFMVIMVLAAIKMLQRLKARLSFGHYFMILVLVSITIRAVMIHTGFPFWYQDIRLFSSRYYASSQLTPSLADLLLNALLIAIWAYELFYGYRLLVRKLSKSSQTNGMGGVFVSVMLLVGMGIYYLFYLTVLSLNTHSSWLFDVTKNVQVNEFLVLSVVIFVLGALTLFLISHIIYQLTWWFIRRFQISLVVFIVSLVFMAVSFAISLPLGITSTVFIAYLVLIHAFRLPRFLRRLQYRTFLYLVIGGFPAAIVGAYAIVQHDQRTFANERQRLASQLMIENDIYAEFLLNEVAEKVQNDVFIQSRIFSPYGSKDVIKLKIRRAYLNNYFDKYDIRIFIYNSLGESFDKTTNYFDLLEHFKQYPTDFEHLYFVGRYGQQQTRRYALFMNIRRYNRTVGYVVIDLRQKRIIPSMVYTTVALDNSEGFVNNPDFDYAIIEGGKVKFKYGAVNYTGLLNQLVASKDKLMHDGIRLAGKRHYGYTDEQDRLIIISYEKQSGVLFFVNFCMLFIFTVFTVAIYLLILSFMTGLQRLPQNYTTRIQLYLNFAFFSPLVIVSATTISIIIKTNRDLAVEQSLDKAGNVSARIAGLLDAYLAGQMESETLSNELIEMGRFGGYDLNLYNRSGKLIATTQRPIYNNGLLSEYIDPGVRKNIIEENDEYVFNVENIGTLQFDNAYVAVKSFETGELTGVLSLPFFTSQRELEQRIINVFNNIIVVFTIVFVAFLAAAYYVSDWLTLPLRLITQRLKKTTLTERNEPLKWESDDEFGLMVGEYNNMIEKLEESKKALARSQKESAWREIARQVAHEIKNPLTPMKLTLQHMQRTTTDDEAGQQKHKQFTSLLHQVETLSEIATSFSAFAKMPVPEREEFDLIQLLHEQVEIFGKQAVGTLITQLPAHRVQVNADRKWLGRAFNNIIINGFQACADHGQPEVQLTVLQEDDHHVLVTIKDNGTGIPEEVQEKIFTPNFTTRQTGTGIGLAVARRAVEHAGGDIWFETGQDSGTTFFIKLPVVADG